MCASTTERVFHELLDAWEKAEHSLIGEFSNDFDSDGAKLAERRAMWLRRWEEAAEEIEGCRVLIDEYEGALKAIGREDIIGIAREVLLK